MVKIKRRKCFCGCGRIVSPGKNFLKGHVNRSYEVRKKISESHKGMRPTEETKKKLRLAQRGKIPWNKGREWSEEAKTKISIGIKRGHTKEGMARVGEANKRRIWSQESKDKCAKSRKGKCFKFTEQHKRNIGLSSKGRKHSEDDKKKMSCSMKKHFLDSEFCRKWFETRRILPNKLELHVQSLLDDLFPGEYRYVGDFSTFIGGKCPDFMNVNGQKKLIEVFGNYWHERDDSKERIEHFQQYGFKTLVLWEKDIMSFPDEVRETLLGFHLM